MKPSPQSIFRVLLSSPKYLSSLFAVNPLSNLQSQATINRLFVSIDLPLLDISYKWDHTVKSLLHLTSQLACWFWGSPCCSVHQQFIPFSLMDLGMLNQTHSQNKTHLAMIHNIHMLLHSVFWYFIQKINNYIHRDIGM